MPVDVEGVKDLTPDEAHALFDEQARRHLGISGQEFLRRWDAGDYSGKPEDRRVTLVASLLPFARQNGARARS